MKKILLFAFAGMLTLPALAQKSKKQSKNKAATASQEVTPPRENPAQRAALMESRMIGPMHHMMVQWAGHWRQEVKIWNDPNTEPTVTRLEVDGRIVSEGRFLSSDIMGRMANMPYDAHSVLGYDNVKRVFVKVWYDNFATSILTLEGSYDEKKQIIDFKGVTMDPLTKHPVKVRQILHIGNPSTQILEVFMENEAGEEMKTMEITATRN